MDRNKVIKWLDVCKTADRAVRLEEDYPCRECPYKGSPRCMRELVADALALLKEQEEREKAICKGICDFISGSCSTDTYEDKEYVCNIIQQMFMKKKTACDGCNYKGSEDCPIGTPGWEYAFCPNGKL